MIYSSEYKFLYIAIPKTGTTSMEKILNVNGLNYEATCKSLNINKKRLPGLPFYGTYKHITMYEVMMKLKLNFQNLYKFATVRNPYDRAVSDWRYWNILFKDKTDKEISFTEFCDCIQNNKKLHVNPSIGWTSGRILRHQQIDYIKGPNKEIAIDQLVYIEHMNEHFEIVRERLNLNKQKIPCLNKTKHLPYSRYYDNKTKKIITEEYIEDIETFKYKF